MSFEWQDNQFVQRIDGGIDVSDCLMSNWGYSNEPDENGFRVLFIKNQVASSSYTDYYQWNGESYVFDKRDYGFKKVDDIVYQLHWAYTRTNEAIAILHEILPATKNQSSEYGPGFFDYLRFQLGLLYAVQGDIDEARIELQNIVDAPTPSSITTIPQAAQAFLEQYTNHTSIYHACSASLEVMQKAIDPFQTLQGEPSDVQMLQAWGYNGKWPLRPLCDLDLVFPYLVSQFQSDQISDLPSALRQAGAAVEHSLQLDVDADGDQDWIAVINKPTDNNEPEATVWLILQEKQGLTTLPVNGESIDITSARGTFAADTAITSSDEQKPITFLQCGDELFVFQVSQSETGTPSLEKLVHLYPPVVAYSVEANAGRPTLTVSYQAEESGPTTETYLWDDEENEFKAERIMLEVFAERAANAMLQTNTAAEAIPALQTVVAYPSESCNHTELEAYYCDSLLTARSRYHYLLALAYELTGDEAAAVQTYWQLWYDFPHSPYALMARAKLEAR